ncbi:MAG: hypothetical protein LIO79_01875 [Rikenellaceae bacterium]|nr:hypothetical protein [Rikenellaceae bacterium]
MIRQKIIFLLLCVASFAGCAVPSRIPRDFLTAAYELQGNVLSVQHTEYNIDYGEEKKELLIVYQWHFDKDGMIERMETDSGINYLYRHSGNTTLLIDADNGELITMYEYFIGRKRTGILKSSLPIADSIFVVYTHNSFKRGLLINSEYIKPDGRYVTLNIKRKKGLVSKYSMVDSDEGVFAEYSYIKFDHEDNWIHRSVRSKSGDTVFYREEKRKINYY